MVNVTVSVRAKSTAFIRNDRSIWLFRHVGGGGAGRVRVGDGVGVGVGTTGAADLVGVGRGLDRGAGVVAVGDGVVAVVAAATGRAVCDLHPAATGSTMSVATNTTAPRITRISPPKPFRPNVLRSMPESARPSNGLKLADDGRKPRECAPPVDLG